MSPIFATLQQATAFVLEKGELAVQRLLVDRDKAKQEREQSAHLERRKQERAKFFASRLMETNPTPGPAPVLTKTAAILPAKSVASTVPPVTVAAPAIAKKVGAIIAAKSSPPAAPTVARVAVVSSPKPALVPVPTPRAVSAATLPAARNALSNTLTHPEFSALSPAERMKFCAAGGKLTGPTNSAIQRASLKAEIAKVAAAHAPKPRAVVSYAVFNTWSPAEKSKFCCGGGRLIDLPESTSAKARTRFSKN